MSDKVKTLKLQKELAKANALVASLTDTIKQNSTPQLTKEELAEVYDPANPQAVADAIKAKTDKHNSDLSDLLAKLSADADKVASDKFSDKKLTVQELLKDFSDTNKLKDVDYEYLLNNVPPVITKKLQGEGQLDEATIKAVLEEAKPFLVTKPSGTYTPTPPHNHANGSAGGSTSGGVPDVYEEDD